jgi:predicted permease
MSVVATIAPIFLVILAGYAVKRTGVVSETFYGEANRFAYYVSLPLLIFTGTLKSGLTSLSGISVFSVVVPTLVMFFIGIGIGLGLGLRRGRLGTFIQTTYHGNVSYVGLAVVFYLLGEKGLDQASLIIGFLIITTNGLSTIILSLTSGMSRSRNPFAYLLPLAKNPVIISSLTGLFVLYLGLPVPDVLLRSMRILANIALPLALITIGASLTLGSIKASLKFSACSATIKLLLLPCLGILFFKALHLPLEGNTASILLLATPVATLSFIMAEAMGGDGELASSAVTLTTLMSGFTYIFWALVLGLAR